MFGRSSNQSDPRHEAKTVLSCSISYSSARRESQAIVCTRRLTLWEDQSPNSGDRRQIGEFDSTLEGRDMHFVCLLKFVQKPPKSAVRIVQSWPPCNLLLNWTDIVAPHCNAEVPHSLLSLPGQVRHGPEKQGGSSFRRKDTPCFVTFTITSSNIIQRSGRQDVPNDFVIYFTLTLRKRWLVARVAGIMDTSPAMALPCLLQAFRTSSAWPWTLGEGPGCGERPPKRVWIQV